jgi:hypothetical protein
MFSPYKVSAFQEKVVSLYVAQTTLNAGALVDLDATDTSAISGQVGFTTMVAGSVKLATVTPQSNGGYYGTGTGTNALVAANFGREMGVVIPNVNTTGPTLEERLLALASSYMTVAVGNACAVFVPSGGDIIATTEFVGYLSGDSAATGYINPAANGSLGAPCGIFQGRFRLVQTTDQVRARFLGNTNLNGAVVGLFQFVS